MTAEIIYPIIRKLESQLNKTVCLHGWVVIWDLVRASPLS
jgi:hypothetical protein